MIALDTNVLARFYCEDPEDPEAGRQRPTARRIVLGSKALLVPLNDRRRARRARRLGLAPAAIPTSRDRIEL